MKLIERKGGYVLVGKEIESQTNILYVPVKRKQEFWEKERRSQGKREIHPIAVEIC